MPTFKDLTGKKFGKWTVLRRIPNTSPIAYDCKCSCGYKGRVAGANLRSGVSNGCRECGHARRTRDLIGKRYGRLTVVQEGKRFEPRNRTVVCTCSCGKRVTVRVLNLTSGNTRSCGCLQREVARVAMKSEAQIRARSSKYNISGVDMTISDMARITGLSKATIEYRLRAGWTPLDSLYRKRYKKKAPTNPKVSGSNKRS